MLMPIMIVLGTVNEDDSRQQRQLRDKIRRAKAGLADPNQRPRKLLEDDMVDLTAPRREAR
jgi:hypothetical protein